MIARKDFAPRTIVKDGDWLPSLETMEVITARANDWIRESAVRVINVETVVIPGHDETKPQPSEVTSSGYTGASWQQVVRVWYEVEVPPVI